jgi:hypothetical protein
MTELHNLPEEKQQEIKARMLPDWTPLFKEDGSLAIPKLNNQENHGMGYCRKNGKIYSSLAGFFITGHYDYLTDEERNYRRDILAEKQEKHRFEKAAKIKYSDWNGDQFFDGEDFWPDLGTYFDAVCEGLGYAYEDYPKYVWNTIEKPFLKPKDVYGVFENDLENSGEWAYEAFTNAVGKDELDQALKDFVEKNKKRMTLYFPDYSTAILLDDEIAKLVKELKDDEFNDWLDDIKRLAKKHGMKGFIDTQTEEEWMKQFEDDLSPEDIVSTEISYSS